MILSGWSFIRDLCENQHGSSVCDTLRDGDGERDHIEVVYDTSKFKNNSWVSFPVKEGQLKAGTQYRIDFVCPEGYHSKYGMSISNRSSGG